MQKVLAYEIFQVVPYHIDRRESQDSKGQGSESDENPLCYSTVGIKERRTRKRKGGTE